MIEIIFPSSPRSPKILSSLDLRNIHRGESPSSSSQSSITRAIQRRVSSTSSFCISDLFTFLPLSFEAGQVFEEIPPNQASQLTKIRTTVHDLWKNRSTFFFGSALPPPAC